VSTTDLPTNVGSNDQLGPVAEGAYRCIAPACTPLGCCGCNCAVPADVYAALGRAFQDVERERCAKLCDEASTSDDADSGHLDRFTAEWLAARIREA
jgi:hypothetical protein